MFALSPQFLLHSASHHGKPLCLEEDPRHTGGGLVVASDWNGQTMDVEVSIVMGVAPNGWFTRGNPIKMDDLGVPLF